MFVVHQPTGRDPATGQIIPTMDLSPAAEYGEIVFLLRDFENPFNDPQAAAIKVAQALEEADYWENDYLLLVGNPILIGLVAACATVVCPQLNLLQWDRARGCYNAAPPIHMDHVQDALDDPDALDYDPDKLDA